MKKIITILSVVIVSAGLFASVASASNIWRGCNGDGTHGLYQRGAAFGNGLNSNGGSAVWYCY